MESSHLSLRFPSLVGAVGLAVVVLLCIPENLQSVSGISVEDDLLLTMNQKKILDKVKVKFKNRNIKNTSSQVSN